MAAYKHSLAIGMAGAMALLAPVEGNAVSSATAPFNARPTTAYECSSLIAARGPDGLWVGEFSGRREVEWGFIRYDDAHRTACFLDERNCRNWLYNMQSEYTAFVWRAECHPGALR